MNDMLAIKTEGLTKRYKDKIAVDNLNLEIYKGELFALLGVNGAGKTTAIKTLTSLTKQSSGRIFINNMDFNENQQKLKEIMNVSPQETAIAPNLTVKENLEFMAGIYKVDNREQKINELIEKFRLGEVLSMKAKKLSGGWQRKLSIALALINSPQILFLDEPTVALDVIARHELWKTIEQLKGKITIILTTHYMEEAEALSDRIGIMSAGRLKCVGTCEELISLSKADTFEKAFVALASEEVVK